MKLENQIMNRFSQLPDQDKNQFLKLICLLNFCPGFIDDFRRAIPITDTTVTQKQLDSVTALIDKWLYKEGYAGLVRAELASAGVEV